MINYHNKLTILTVIRIAVLRIVLNDKIFIFIQHFADSCMISSIPI